MTDHSAPTRGEEAKRLVQTIEEAGHGWSVNLTKLVDGETEYTLTYHGEKSVYEDSEYAYRRLRELQEAEKTEAALAFVEKVRLAAIEECANVAETLFTPHGYPAVARNAGKSIADQLRNLGRGA